MRTEIRKLSQHTKEPISPTDTQQQILVFSRGQEEKAKGQSVRRDKGAQAVPRGLQPAASGWQRTSVVPALLLKGGSGP